jgi:two-component system chemotaxis sensor kinase CheA
MSAAPVDAELEALFAQEAADRLDRLTEQLLQLELTPNDPELVSSLFREAHTIKGSASVVGFHEVGGVAHAMEDVLEQLRRGERLASPDLIDTVLKSVDGLRELVDAALQGEERREQAAALKAVLAAAAESRPALEPVLAAAAETRPAKESLAPEAEAPAPPEGREEGTGKRVHAGRGDGSIRVPVRRIDDIVRLVGEAASAHLRVGRRVAECTGAEGMELSEFRDLSSVLNELQEKSMRARMVPVATVTESLHRAVRDTARALGKRVKWEVRGEDTELDRSVLEQLADPLLQLVRNSVDHGIESAEERAALGKPELGVVRLHAMQIGSEVIIAISDDGRGIDVERVRGEATRAGGGPALTDEEALYLVFRSGVSTADFVSDISGRGVGLDVVRSSMDAVRGRVQVHSEPGAGTEFRLAAPITLAVLPCLVVLVGEDRYAIPIHSVLLVQDRMQDVDTTSHGRPMVWIGEQPVAVSSLRDVLGLDVDCDGPVVVVSAITRTHAFRVSGLDGQRDVLVKGLGGLLPRFDVLTGASVDPDGSILLVLVAHD